MTKWPATTVLLACLLAATDLVATELASAGDTIPLAGNASPLRIGIATRPLARAETPSAATLAAWSDTVLSRPLYANDRRPTPGDKVSGSLPRLSGILIGGVERRAFLSMSGSTKAISGGPGARLGSWTIGAIEPDHVTLTGPDGTHTLRLAYAPEAELAARDTPPAAGGDTLAFNTQASAPPGEGLDRQPGPPDDPHIVANPR